MLRCATHSPFEPDTVNSGVGSHIDEVSRQAPFAVSVFFFVWEGKGYD